MFIQDSANNTVGGLTAKSRNLSSGNISGVHITSGSPGNVIAPLRLADTALAALLRPGDVVDVIAADTQAEQAVVVAAGARVVTIPELPDERAGPGLDGALVLIDVDAQTASIVAKAAASAALSVIWR